MKIVLSFWLLFLATSQLFAQQASPTPQLYSEKTLNELVTIQRAALASDYALRQTAHLSNNIGPRLSGSPQAAKAVEYIAEEMRKLGLEVRLQPIMVPHWVRGAETAEIVEWTGMAAGTTQKIVVTALGGSVATPAAGLTAEVIVVNDFAELGALGHKAVEGKIVLFNNKFDREMAASGFGGQAYGQAVAYRFAGAMAAARLGAVAVLVRSAGGSQNRLAHTGSMGYADGVQKIPGGAIPFEDAETLGYLAKAGRVRLRLILTPQTLPDAPSFNVIGDLKGSERPDEVVIVSGHLDSWDLGTGALDDAAGVAVSIQVANLLRELKLRPKRTIRVIAWMNEEKRLARQCGLRRRAGPKCRQALCRDRGRPRRVASTGYFVHRKAGGHPIFCADNEHSSCTGKLGSPAAARRRGCRHSAADTEGAFRRSHRISTRGRISAITTRPRIHLTRSFRRNSKKTPQ